MNDCLGPLDTASNEDLIAELRRRHAATLIVLMSEPNKDTKNHMVAFSGGPINAIGLCEYAKHYVLEDMASERREAAG